MMTGIKQKLILRQSFFWVIDFKSHIGDCSFDLPATYKT
jgi:hypothetical protein